MTNTKANGNDQRKYNRISGVFDLMDRIMREK